jgi:AcrR family transcriptional regulator
MARRADHTPEELRELIVNAAQVLILSEGIEKLSARSLSRQIGYAPGTLYNHFKDLDDIVTAVNARTLAGVAQAFAAAAPADDPRARLHNYADAFIDFIDAHPRLWQALFEFKREEGAPIPDWYRQSIEGLANAIAPSFKALRPSASDREAAEAGKLVFASIHSVTSLQKSGRLALLLDRDTREVVHELVDIHIRSFSAQPLKAEK